MIKQVTHWEAELHVAELREEHGRVNGPDPSYVCARCGDVCVGTGDFPYCSYACHYYSDEELAAERRRTA